MHSFVFNSPIFTKDVYCADLPVGIKSKTDLINALSSVLRFPDYFGGNWDAFEECIRDLSWLPKGNVVLNHMDLPLSKDIMSLSTYLLILKNAVEKWNATGERKLIVIFPPEAKVFILNVLADKCTNQ